MKGVIANAMLEYPRDYWGRKGHSAQAHSLAELKRAAVNKVPGTATRREAL